jgi:hypothetical protein
MSNNAILTNIGKYIKTTFRLVAQLQKAKNEYLASL